MEGKMAAGRPRINIDKENFEKLCGLQCTLNEIAGFFRCSEDTIERWTKRTYNEKFADVFKKHSAQGKISLRRYQFRLAEKSAAMAIFLGKQYLGQRDNIDMGVERDGSLADLINGLRDPEAEAGAEQESES
jgi:hypothetical protein